MNLSQGSLLRKRNCKYCVLAVMIKKRKRNEKPVQVKSVIETEDGVVELEANLSAKEAAFVLEVGLNTLMREGALPFVHNTPENTHQEPESVQ
jgi:hypothetical protein